MAERQAMSDACPTHSQGAMWRSAKRCAEEAMCPTPRGLGRCAEKASPREDCRELREAPRI